MMPYTPARATVRVSAPEPAEGTVVGLVVRETEVLSVMTVLEAVVETVELPVVEPVELMTGVTTVAGTLGVRFSTV